MADSAPLDLPMEFVLATEAESDALTVFAVASHDTHGTRVCDDSVARGVLNVGNHYLSIGNVEKIVSTADGSLLGFFSLKDLNSETLAIELGHVFVHPKFIGRGIGKKLFLRAVEKAKEIGSKKMHWISDPEAVDFYLKLGAAKVGEDENLLNPAKNISLMELDIA